MTKNSFLETQQEFNPEPDSGVTVVADEDVLSRSTDEFITFEQIRQIIGADNSCSNLEQFDSIKDLGHGGVGAILSAKEKILTRDVAIKILRPAYRKKKRSVGRMIREARATARIEHPNIVPVHSLGVLDDVGVFFTMKRIYGETLQDVLYKLEKGDHEYREKYSASRLLEIFIAVCHGVAFAHNKGIIHRDLKPANIMLGDFGEVLVMDWGLVKFKGEDEESELFGVYSESHGDKMLTLDGTITGTPLFMSPEQACGWSAEVDEQSDIYSLGVILYAILTYRQSPFKNSNNIREVLDKVANGDFPPPHRAAIPKVPRELEAICLKAMSKRKCDRYLTVRDLLKDIRNYRDGYQVSAYQAPLLRRVTRFCRRNRLTVGAIAIALLTLVAFMSVKATVDYLDYRSYQKAADYNSEAADQARMRAFAVFRQLKRDNDAVTVNDLSENKQLEASFRRYCTEFENRYNMALIFFSKIEEMYRRDKVVRDGVSDIYRKMCEFAIACRDFEYADKVAGMMTMRSRDLSYLNEDARRTFLKMRQMASIAGELSVESIPLSGTVILWRLNDDSTVSQPQRLGRTPIQNKEIPPGTYLAVLKCVGRQSIKYPFNLGRAEQRTIKLFVPSSIPKNMVYIPGGYLTENTQLSQQRVYVKSFFICRYEVTFGEYLQFWRSLRDAGERERFCARRYSGQHHFTELWDSTGKLIQPYRENLPVVGITAEAATAYCRWLSKNTGHRYRLPSAIEWQRAARGIDGRYYVWGNRFSTDLALTESNREGKKRFTESAPPGSFPGDASLFGVYDMGGNVRELTSSLLPGAAASQIVCGASWATGKEFLDISHLSSEMLNYNDVGFRYIQEIPESWF